MKHQKYVCLEGMFIKIESSTQNNPKQLTYLWAYEKIKTKKGCASYFNNCN
jgi:hypothetical protein